MDTEASTHPPSGASPAPPPPPPLARPPGVVMIRVELCCSREMPDIMPPPASDTTCVLLSSCESCADQPLGTPGRPTFTTAGAGGAADWLCPIAPLGPPPHKGDARCRRWGRCSHRRRARVT